MRIVFTETVQLESEGRHKGPVYQEGDIHDVPEATAQRWLRRRKAVLAPADEPAPAEAAPAAVELPQPEDEEPAPATTSDPAPAAGPVSAKPSGRRRRR